VDLIAIYLTGVATLLLLAIPFLPGLRDIPRWVPMHRLVWRGWNPTEAINDPATHVKGSANAPLGPTARESTE
jgi:hypothetical protein